VVLLTKLLHARGEEIIVPALVIRQEEPDQRCFGDERLVVAGDGQFVFDGLVADFEYRIQAWVKNPESQFDSLNFFGAFFCRNRLLNMGKTSLQAIFAYIWRSESVFGKRKKSKSVKLNLTHARIQHHIPGGGSAQRGLQNFRFGVGADWAVFVGAHRFAVQ
jgi:hypothetical protein